MAAIVVTRGKLRIGQQASESTNYNAARNIQAMSVDDSSVAFAAADLALNTGGAVANEYFKDFDATPTETAPAVITHVMTVPTGSGNFTIRRIALHDQPTALPLLDSTQSLVAGIDGQSLTKTSDFTIQFTLTITYA